MTSEEERQSILKAIDDYLQAEDQRPLAKAQRTLLEWFLKDLAATYRQIAEASGYQPGSLRDAASKLYKTLDPIVTFYSQSTTPTTDKRRRVIEAVIAWYQQRNSGHTAQLSGRQEELNHLVSEIDRSDLRLICISGPIGIGKTQFVRLLGRQLKATHPEGFEHQIFCLASEDSTVEKLYRHVVRELSQAGGAPKVDPVPALTDLLRHRRLLLIIDKGDLLCDPNSLEGRFKPEARCFEQWLGNLRDIYDLQSCLIWVGRIEPRLLRGGRDHLRSHRLLPLEPASAQTLLIDRFNELRRSQRLHPSQQEIETLTAFCGRNPGVLDLAARKICEDGGNSITRFLDAPLRNTYAEDEDWQTFLDSITAQEQMLLGWMLLYPDEKKHPDETSTAPSELSYEDRQWLQDGSPAAEMLVRRGLLETDAAGYYRLQSPWLCHVAARHLVDRLSKLFEAIVSQPENEPLLAEKIHILGQHPLIAPQAPAWKRDWQRRHVLQALVDRRLPACLWSQTAKQNLIARMLQYIRQAAPEDDRLREGFAVGNLLNLAAAIGIPLKNLDFSGLVIRHADLRFAQIQQANFSSCQLRNTVLPVALHYPIAAALSPDGSTLAIGDSQGSLLCWRRDRIHWQLDLSTQIPAHSQAAPITKLAFGDERMLAIATDQGIWFLYPGELPQPVTPISSPVTSLICNLDHVVASLGSGEICVWSSLTGQVTLLPQYHTNAVEALVFDSGGGRFSSLGFEDRILTWNLFNLEAEPEVSQLMCRPEAIAWKGDQLLTVGLLDRQYQIGSPTGQRTSLPYAHAAVTGMCFSQNGQYFAVMQRDAIEVWQTAQQTTQQTTQQTAPMSLMHRISISDPLLLRTLSDDGTWLLTLSQDQTRVQLWAVESGRLEWEQRSPNNAGNLHAANPPILADCSGLAQTEKLYFKALGADVGDDA